MTTTPTELELLRNYSQKQELHLSIFKRSIVLVGLVNDPSITKGARNIVYAGVSLPYSGNEFIDSGSYDYHDIKSGMNMLVGTSTGDSSYGKVRVRSATNSSILVAENSDVKWVNGAVITIVNVIDIVPIFPRIIQDPSNAENTLWYKDYDIPYTNQNSILGSYICMGPHRAGNLDSSGECRFYFSASGTQHSALSGIASYAWEFPGSSGLFPLDVETPGWVIYNNAQHTVAKLTVTSVNGSVDESYRYISVYPQNKHIQGWEISNIQGSRAAGGFTASIIIHEPLEYSVYEGAPIILYTKSRYGNTEIDLGGNSENNESIFFVCYVLKNSIKFSYDRSSVEFTVGSDTEVMKSINGFAISVENSVGAPTTWYQIQHNNLLKSIYHFLRWHSTVLLVSDFQATFTDKYIQYFDSDRGSVYDAVSSVLSTALLGEFVADRQGKLWAETSMQAIHNAKTAFTPEFTLLKRDWMGEPSIQEVSYDEISYMELGGVQYDPANSNPDTSSIALLACAPGVTPSNHGKADSPTGLALTSQTELNKIVGDVFAYRNAKLPEISVELRGAYLNLDIAPIHVLQTNIAKKDTVKNIEIINPYFVDSLSMNYKGDQKLIRTVASLHEITEGVPGDTIVIPVIPPDDIPTPPPWEPFPPLPPIPNPYIPPVVSPNLLAILIDQYGLFYTSLDDVTHAWYPNNPFTDAQRLALNKFELSRTGMAYVSSYREVYSTQLGSNLLNIVGSEAYIQSIISDYGNPYYVQANITGLGMDYTKDDGLGVIVSRAYPVFLTASFTVKDGLLVFSGGYPNLQVAYDPVYMSNWGLKWYVTYLHGTIQSTAVTRMTNTLDSRDYIFPVDGPYILSHIHARSADYIYTLDNSNLERYTNTGETQAAAGLGVFSEIDCDPTGQYVMGVVSNTPMDVKLSSNFGTSFTIISTLPAVYACSNVHVLNLGSSLKWVVTYRENIPGQGLTQKLYMTIDGGATWGNIAGNLYAVTGQPPADAPILRVRYA